MSVIHGTYRDGKIILDAPPNWPEGKRVYVVDSLGSGDLVMLADEEQGTDPESIAEWLKWFDSLEPLRMTAEDEAAMHAWRKRMKEVSTEAVRRQTGEDLP